MLSEPVCVNSAEDDNDNTCPECQADHLSWFSISVILLVTAIVIWSFLP